MSRKILLAAIATMLVAGGTQAIAQSSEPAAAPKPGIKRTPLQSMEVPSSSYKSTMGMGELPPTVCSGRHSHPGVEMTYVLEGDVVLAVDGQPEVTYKQGESFQVPMGTIHEVKNPHGEKSTKLLSTWIWEKDKPMATAATTPAPDVTTATAPKK